MTFREDHARIVRIEADSIAGMVQCILRRSHFGITNLAYGDLMNTFRRWAEKSRFWDRLYLVTVAGDPACSPSCSSRQGGRSPPQATTSKPTPPPPPPPPAPRPVRPRCGSRRLQGLAGSHTCAGYGGWWCAPSSGAGRSATSPCPSFPARP